MDDSAQSLAAEIRGCNLCAELPLGPRPLLQIDAQARILIAGQAPGRKTHEKGIPFDDASGDRLRQWLGVDREAFYNPEKFAILPMAFCYPGTGKSGDLPPRPLCAETWRTKALATLSNIALTLVIGQYAMDWHLQIGAKQSLTKTVSQWQDHWPDILPLPHPSPRNNIWLKRNDWFERDVLPALQGRIKLLLEQR